MNLKTLPLVLLLITLPIVTSFTQTPKQSPTKQSNDYGIEPGKSYSGTIVLELLQAAEAEIDASVNEAYAEGFKAGLLASSPDAEYYKSLSESIRAELEAERKRNSSWKDKLLFGFAGVVIGAAGMSAAYFLSQ